MRQACHWQGQEHAPIAARGAKGPAARQGDANNGQELQYLTPERCKALGEDRLRSAGLSRQKASYLLNIADAFAEVRRFVAEHLSLSSAFSFSRFLSALRSHTFTQGSLDDLHSLSDEALRHLIFISFACAAYSPRRPHPRTLHATHLLPLPVSVFLFRPFLLFDFALTGQNLLPSKE